MPLLVKKLDPKAILPQVAHEGDLGYDLFALEEAMLVRGMVVKVRTGIAIEASDEQGRPLGMLVRDRSSLAAAGVVVTGGVIDAGYRGEITVLMTNIGADWPTRIWPGDKIAQMIPVPVLTGEVREVEELNETVRAGQGFGSTGR